MELGIKGKKALVVGASGLLGTEISRQLIEEDVDVVGLARHPIQFGTFYQIDLMKEAIAHTQKLAFDIVVHNIGGTLPGEDNYDWEKMIRFNLGIQSQINELALPYMLDKHWGRIVHISSIASIKGHSSVIYASVKSAVNTYVRKMGYELAKEGIVISAVMPGPIERASQDDIGICRSARPEEVANLVLFLCSECCSYMAGSVIPIDGGML